MDVRRLCSNTQSFRVRGAKTFMHPRASSSDGVLLEDPCRRAHVAHVDVLRKRERHSHKRVVSSAHGYLTMCVHLQRSA
eukprot:4203427-Pyramimonas_sp.AAC.1